MNIYLIILIILIWIALGLHSAYFLVKQYTKEYDFTFDRIPMLVFCILAPIFTHIATLLIYYTPSDKKSSVFSKVLFSKKKTQI